jgi:hypothetical protein
MTQINVLVAVDVGHALTLGANANVGQYVFMEDTTGSMSSGQGGNELTTTCTNGDTIVWQVVSIDPTLTISILSFSGAAIGPTAMINPAPYPQYQGTVWGGHVNLPGTNVQYSLNLLLNGSVHAWFDPFLTSVNPTTAVHKAK